MKTGHFYKAFGFGVLLGMMPLIVSANESGEVVKHLELAYSSSSGLSLIDSVPKNKPKDEKPKPADTDEKHPTIKGVPKARPQLRPGIVIDKVKLKRPPIRIPRKLGGPLGL